MVDCIVGGEKLVEPVFVCVEFYSCLSEGEEKFAFTFPGKYFKKITIFSKYEATDSRKCKFM
jgi:hypothetical protein